MAIDPTGSYANVTNYGNNNMSAYAIGSNGALSPIGEDLTKLGKQVPVLLAIGFNGGSGTAPHKQ